MDTPTDIAGHLETALNEVCFGSDADFPLEPSVDRYFTPDYRQRTDGETVDRAGFVAHIGALRSKVAEGRIEVLRALRSGDQVADHHRVTATKTDGTATEVEVYLFAEMAPDGRLRFVDEVTRVVEGSGEDADLARAR